MYVTTVVPRIGNAKRSRLAPENIVLNNFSSFQKKFSVYNSKKLREGIRNLPASMFLPYINAAHPCEWFNNKL
jgi:hypothetical protein